MTFGPMSVVGHLLCSSSTSELLLSVAGPVTPQGYSPPRAIKSPYLTPQLSPGLARRSHFAIRCNKSGNGMFGPNLSISVSLRYWPFRSHSLQTSRTIGLGYSARVLEPDWGIVTGARMGHGWQA